MSLSLDDVQYTIAADRTREEANETLLIAAQAALAAIDKTPGVFSILCLATPHSISEGRGDLACLHVALKHQKETVYGCLSGVGAITKFLPLKQRLKIAMGVIMGKDVSK